MPRTRRLRNSNISEDVIASFQLDSDDEPILKSQRETRTRSSLNKSSLNNSSSRTNSAKRITRQSTIVEFLKPSKNEESSDTSDNNSIDNSKASKSMGMKCPRPDLKPIKSLVQNKNSKKSMCSKRETRQSLASSNKKRQKIMRLSSGESDSEYESLSSLSLDDDILSRESEYHSSYTDVEDESETDETELNLSDSAGDNTNNISSDETQLLDENTKDDDDETELPIENLKVCEEVDSMVKESKSPKKSGKKKGEFQRKPLTEEETKEKEERLKRIEETVNRVLNNPNITLSEEAMKPRPRYNKPYPPIKVVKEVIDVKETVKMVVDEVADKAFRETTTIITPINSPEKVVDSSHSTPSVKPKKKKISTSKETNITPSIVEKNETDTPAKQIIQSPENTSIVKSAKVIGRRGRPPGSPNKKKKAPEIQKFLQTDYSKITERPGIVEPILEEINLDKKGLSNSLTQFRKLIKTGTINKQSIKSFKDLHESLSHVAREITHEHDSLLRLLPNNKCRANDRLKIRKRLLKAIGEKVSDKFIRKALKGDDDYILDDLWIQTEHADERHLYHKMTSEGVISQFQEEIKELITPPSITKLVEVFKTFRLNDEASQKICEFDYPTAQYEPPINSSRKIAKKNKNHLPEGSKDSGTPVPSNEKSTRKILEPIRKSTRRKARGETPDKSMEKRITRSQNNAVKVPSYNEVKRKRRRNIKRGIFLKGGRGRFQKIFNKRRFYKKIDVYSPIFADNYREKHFESIIQVVLNYFATNDILVDFRHRNFWDFLLSDSEQLNSLFNNRIEYVRNIAKNQCSEEQFHEMSELLKNIERAIPGVTKERRKRMETDGILRNDLFRNDVIAEYQSIYENFASKVAIKEYGWEIFYFHKPKPKNKNCNKMDITNSFNASVPEKMLINRLLLSRSLSNIEKWSRYVDYCKDRKLHSFFEERNDLWNKSDCVNKFTEEKIKGITLESIKEGEQPSNQNEIDEQRKLKDLIWERDYMPTSDPVTRRLFNLKKELHELMYERNKTLDQIFESSIAFIVRDIIEKKALHEEEELKKMFDGTSIEKEDDLDQIPLNKDFMEKNTDNVETVKNLGTLSNLLGTVSENIESDNNSTTNTSNVDNGGSSNGLTKKSQVKYKCFIKNNEVFFKKYIKKNNSRNESSIDETLELSSDKNKIAKDSQNPLKRKRELKDSTVDVSCSTAKRRSGMLKKLDSLNKEKNKYFWRTSFKIPNVDNRLTRRGLKNLENSLLIENSEESDCGSSLSFPENVIKNTIPTENEKKNESSNNEPIWHQLQKITNSQGNNKLKNSDKDNKIGISPKKK